MTTRITTFTAAETNRERVLAYLIAHKSVTPMRALTEWGETRLAARIHELVTEGYCIEAQTKHALNGKRYAEYTLDCDACRDGALAA